MILDGWEGDPWAHEVGIWLLLDVNKSQLAACVISFWGQNPGVKSPYGTQTIASQPSQFT
jgi:hypothetical protein